jgi:hypothetical protein
VFKLVAGTFRVVFRVRVRVGLGLTIELPIWNSRAPASQNAESSNSSPPVRSTERRLSLENYNDTLCFLADFSVLVCKYHCSRVVNLNKHLLKQHATPTNVQKEIV